MTSMRSLLCAFATVAIAAVPAPAQNASLEKAAAAARAMHTARGTFEQSVQNSLTGGTATSRGTFAQQQPNKLSITFTEPAGDRIVSDGRVFWLYLPSSLPGEVVKRSVASAPLPFDLAGQFLKDPSRYAVTAAGARTVQGHSAHGFLLVPKTGTSSAFTRATVWVDDDDSLIREFTVADESGVTRQLKLLTLEVNVPIDPASFVFTPPPGVRTIKQ